MTMKLSEKKKLKGKILTKEQTPSGKQYCVLSTGGQYVRLYGNTDYVDVGEEVEIDVEVTGMVENPYIKIVA